MLLANCNLPQPQQLQPQPARAAQQQLSLAPGRCSCRQRAAKRMCCTSASMGCIVGHRSSRIISGSIWVSSRIPRTLATVNRYCASHFRQLIAFCSCTATLSDKSAVQPASNTAAITSCSPGLGAVCGRRYVHQS